MAGLLSSPALCERLPGEWTCYASNFSGGLLLEVFPKMDPNSAAAAAQNCESYILIPAENSWPIVLRAVIYFLAMFYCFVGFAAITACYMTAMETIVQKTRRITKWDPVEGREVTREERIWNPAIADITLLALGTCTPQIALALIDAIQLLGKDQSGGLGPGTIVGGAAFNFFPILGTIVLVPKGGSVKRVENYGVFVVEFVWSIWAYLWVLLIVQWVTPSKVTLWEAVATVLQMPLLVGHAYATDQGWVQLPFSALPLGGRQVEEVVEEGRATPSRRSLPRLPSAAKLYHKWRASYAKYRVQATTAMTAERRPSADYGESASGKLRRKFLSGLSLRRRRGGQSKKIADLKDREREGADGREDDGEGRGGRELQSIAEGAFTRSPEVVRRRSSLEARERPRVDVAELDDYLSSTGVTRIDSDTDLTSMDESPHEGSPGLAALPGSEKVTWSEIFRLWKVQIIDAMSVKGSVDEKGRELLPGVLDFVMHPITFLWKTLFAVIIPPAPLGGGWVAFFAAIVCITGIAAFVIELANLFGCVSGADSFVIALTLLATGTSFPDLIASYIAADHEVTADSAVANINASNSITVFLGLGFPWVMSVLYNKIKLSSEFQAPAGNLAFTLFTYFGAIALGVSVLVARRKYLGGELGGKRLWAIISSAFFFFLWFMFLLLSSLRSYSHI